MPDEKAVDRRQFLISAATGASVSASLLTSSRCAPPDITAAASQRVHPVLMRNDHSELIRVTLDVAEGEVRATAFMFSLAGTDDLADIETLQLHYADEHGPEELDHVHSGSRFSVDKRELLAELTAAPFGEPSKPADELTISGDQALHAGSNVFWLACKLRATADLSHRVAVQCKAVETSAGSIIPSDSSTGARKRIGITLRKHYDDDVHTYRIPALVTTPKGTLLCVYDMRRRKRRDLQEDIDIGLSRSTDGGQTWEPARVIMDMGAYNGLPQEENGCSDAGIVVDQETGEIFCAAMWMWGKPGKHQWNDDGSEPGYEIGKAAQFLMVGSKDDGVTWGKPVNLTHKLKKAEWILMAPSPEGGITLSDGTLVLPGQGRDENDRRFSTLIISRDHGATWTVGSPSAVGNTECQAVQLDDGSIMLNARTERPTGLRSVYVTEDLGQTWRAHPTHRKTLVEPNCNGSLIRFDYVQDGQSKHVLVFANPYSETGRDHHSIQISFDEGQTWPEEYRLLLDEGQGNGYPTLTQIDERHVGIVYEGSQAHLVFEKFSIDELLGKRG